MFDLLSSGISILKVSLSPILTVSTSLRAASRMRILGGGASGAEVMGIMSGSLSERSTTLDSFVQVILEVMCIKENVNKR